MATMTDTLIPNHDAATRECRLQLALVVHCMADELAAEAAATGDEEVRRAWIEASVRPEYAPRCCARPWS